MRCHWHEGPRAAKLTEAEGGAVASRAARRGHGELVLSQYSFQFCEVKSSSGSLVHNNGNTYNTAELST